MRRASWPQATTPVLLYTSDAADERSSVDLGGRRIIKKNTRQAINDNTDSKTDKSKTQKTQHKHTKMDK